MNSVNNSSYRPHPPSRAHNDSTSGEPFEHMSYTYKPGGPPPESADKRMCAEVGRTLEQTAARVETFFREADNLAFDRDPRPGYVRLIHVSAPKLLEECTGKITGFRTPNGDIHAQDVSNYASGPSSIEIGNHGREVNMLRPSLHNNRHRDTIESLIIHSDGTRTASWDYPTFTG